MILSDTVYLSATTCDPAQAGISLQSLTNANGCDSIIFKTTTLILSDTVYLSATTCDPAQAGISLQSLSNANGCDSIVFTTTALFLSDTVYLSTTTCDPAQAGISLQTFSNTNGCDSIVITTTSLAPNSLDVLLTAFDPACHGAADGGIVIEGLLSGMPPVTLENNGMLVGEIPMPFEINQLSAGAYLLAFEDAQHCRVEQSVVLNDPVELSLQLGGPYTIQLGDSLQLVPTLNFLPDSLSWIPADHVDCAICLEPNASPHQTTQYRLTAYDLNGCSAEASTTVVVEKSIGVYVGNAFSPNGDGRNDELTVFASAAIARIRQFRVFDRWGEVVFRQDNLLPGNSGVGWNGIIDGRMATPGVYVWWVEVEYVNGDTAVISGDAALIL